MAEDTQVVGTDPVPEKKFLLDPYLDWARREGLPVVEDFAVDLLAIETAPWDRFGVRGAFAHLKGRGDFVAVQCMELLPGSSSAPLRHLYDEVFYVLSGTGSCTVKGPDGREHSFEWGPRSVFAPPLNAEYRLYNGSGREPARLASGNNLPMIMNLLHSEEFIFANGFEFADRASPDDWFAGEGQMIEHKPGAHMWETNFIPDLAAFALKEWETRGVGSKNLKLILADSVMHAHTSEMAVGTYKKGHRHGPGAHVFAVTGEGYSLLWYNRDDEFERHEWRHGWVFTPPDGMFHQHFNTCHHPARYLAVSLGSHRYPVTEQKRSRKSDAEKPAEDGGWQIDYDKQDPRIHPLFLAELAKNGVGSQMGGIFDEDTMIAKAAASGAA
jgi:mannose-6-phosphate isomerase-like protein (cupin superfamily)